MRSPPPLTEFIAFPVTSGIALLAIAVTAFDKLGNRSIEPLVMSSMAFQREPWRLFTSALPHGDLLHIAFNVYWLWVFGTLIEEVLGGIRLLGLVLLLACGSAAAEYALFSGGIGLSGVGYGLFGMLWVLSRKDRRFREGVDERTVQLFVLWFFLCIGATITKVYMVANVAHGAGALLGILAGAAIAFHGSKRMLFGAGAAVVTALSLAGGSVLRPYINISSSGGIDSAIMGYEALQEGRNQDALEHYRRAIEINDKQASYWFNKGIAHERLSQMNEAFKSFEQAYRLEPENQKYRSAVADQMCFRGADAQERGQYAEALRYLRECIKLGGEYAEPYEFLGAALHELGRAEESKQAFEKAEALKAKQGKSKGDNAHSNGEEALDAGAMDGSMDDGSVDGGADAGE